MHDKVNRHLCSVSCGEKNIDFFFKQSSREVCLYIANLNSYIVRVTHRQIIISQ